MEQLEKNSIVAELLSRIKILKEKHHGKWSYFSELKEDYDEALQIACDAIAELMLIDVMNGDFDEDDDVD